MFKSLFCWRRKKFIEIGQKSPNLDPKMGIFGPKNVYWEPWIGFKSNQMLHITHYDSLEYVSLRLNAIQPILLFFFFT